MPISDAKLREVVFDSAINDIYDVLRDSQSAELLNFLPRLRKLGVECINLEAQELNQELDHHKARVQLLESRSGDQQPTGSNA